MGGDNTEHRRFCGQRRDHDPIGPGRLTPGPRLASLPLQELLVERRVVVGCSLDGACDAPRRNQRESASASSFRCASGSPHSFAR
jgi:hypothetical protein